MGVNILLDGVIVTANITNIAHLVSHVDLWKVIVHASTNSKVCCLSKMNRIGD